jgi:hypothetical protein
MPDNSTSSRSSYKPPLFKYAFIRRDFTPVLEDLKNLAVAENWEYANTPNDRPLPILNNYIHHTFSRIQEENKILEQDNYSAFNTGLVTVNQQEIFMLFKIKPDGIKFFVEFCTESSANMGRFSNLPKRPSYYSDPSELIFDPRLELRVNIDHIVDDSENFDRFPKSIQKLDKHQLLLTFEGALNYAKRRINRNYKTAIPQYYRGTKNPNGHLQLLLPLCLINPSNADLALAVFKKRDYYVGKTCLTLDMAINNARLVAKPDDEWLKP